MCDLRNFTTPNRALSALCLKLDWQQNEPVRSLCSVSYWFLFYWSFIENYIALWEVRKTSQVMKIEVFFARIEIFMNVQTANFNLFKTSILLFCTGHNNARQNHGWKSVLGRWKDNNYNMLLHSWLVLSHGVQADAERLRVGRAQHRPREQPQGLPAQPLRASTDAAFW